MDWFSAIFAFEEWPMWPLAVEAASNWGERRRFRSRSSHLIPTLYSSTRSRPQTTNAMWNPLLEVLELKIYLIVSDQIQVQRNLLTFGALLRSKTSWLNQFRCNEEVGRRIKARSRKWGNKELVTFWINDNLFSAWTCTEEDFKKAMWGSLRLGVVLHMVGSSVSIQCYDCNKKDRFREMVRAHL